MMADVTQIMINSTSDHKFADLRIIDETVREEEQQVPDDITELYSSNYPTPIPRAELSVLRQEAEEQL